jgi:biotin carboxylase
MRDTDFTGPAVIVDPYSSGALYAPAFAEHGVPVVAVVSGPTPPPAFAPSYRPQDFPEIITWHGDLEPVLTRLAELRPRCVIAGCESGVELAEMLAPRVLSGLCNVPEMASARRHKADMAAAVAAAGLPVIPQICTADPDEVTAWLRQTGLTDQDLVVKPPKSSSTDGVVRIPAGGDWRAAFDAQIGRHNQLGLLNDRLLVQQFVTGTEYVLDTFSHDGVHDLVDVCRYRKVDNGPFMAVYDTMEWVAPDAPDVPELLAYGRAVLDAVGVRFGPVHLEVMRTESGPRLIELGARPHGGGQPRFCQVATGDSQINRTVDYLVGRPVPAGFQLLKNQLVVFLIARGSGIVRNAEVLDQIRDLPSHHFSVHHLVNGHYVPMTRDLITSLELGFAVLSHIDSDQLWTDYNALRQIESTLLLEEPQPAHF